MLLTEIKYSYRDVSIIPTKCSEINSRSECNPYVDGNKLPIFTAPMDSVINLENYKLFEESGITPIIPRTENIEERLNKSEEGVWAAYSLNEFERHFVDGTRKGFVLVDIANGHMKKLFDLVEKVKEARPEEVTIMIGNIANPETYIDIVECRADFVRVGIGSGNGCITTSNVSIHYPMASLVDAVLETKRRIANLAAHEYGYDVNEVLAAMPKIVADGGIRNYSDVIKALALGADYVMIGSLFSRTMESAGKKFITNLGTTEFDPSIYKSLRYDWDKNSWFGYYSDQFIADNNPYGAEDEKEIGKVEVKFYGMASKDGQVALHGVKTKTSEGITKHLPVQYQIKGWVENMVDYLKSAMSYTGHFTIGEFIGNCTVVVCSPNTENAVNK